MLLLFTFFKRSKVKVIYKVKTSDSEQQIGYGQDKQQYTISGHRIMIFFVHVSISVQHVLFVQKNLNRLNETVL